MLSIRISSSFLASDRNLTDSCSLEDSIPFLFVSMEISCFISPITLPPPLNVWPLPLCMEMISCTPSFLPSHILAPQAVTIETECPSSPVISMVTLLEDKYPKDITKFIVYQSSRTLLGCWWRRLWLPRVAAVLSAHPSCEGIAFHLSAKRVKSTD